MGIWLIETTRGRNPAVHSSRLELLYSKIRSTGRKEKVWNRYPSREQWFRPDNSGVKSDTNLLLSLSLSYYLLILSSQFNWNSLAESFQPLDTLIRAVNSVTYHKSFIFFVSQISWIICRHMLRHAILVISWSHT